MLASRKHTILTAALSLIALCGLGSCGEKSNVRTTISGSYHIETPINDVKRGCDINVILNSDRSIYTMALDDNSEYTCPDMQVLWSIKSSGYFVNLGTLGIEGINNLSVTCGEDGLPTEIVGLNKEWLVPMNDAACGLVVLALQNAFTTL